MPQFENMLKILNWTFENGDIMVNELYLKKPFLQKALATVLFKSDYTKPESIAH